MGDGNLSSPNGRVTRLRITCDIQYPDIIADITRSLSRLFPNNSVSHVNRTDSCIDISVYSNTLNECMPWKVGKGSKYYQQARVPDWIFENTSYIKSCLQGLLQTDGSLYKDRGYTMVNFTTISEVLARDVFYMMTHLDYWPKKYQTLQNNGNVKYSIRLSKSVDAFVREISFYKS